MKLERVTHAINEARRFLHVAEAHRAAEIKATKSGERDYSPRLSAATKRASLDLTIALAEMRKPE